MNSLNKPPESHVIGSKIEGLKCSLGGWVAFISEQWSITVETIECVWSLIG